MRINKKILLCMLLVLLIIINIFSFIPSVYAEDTVEETNTIVQEDDVIDSSTIQDTTPTVYKTSSINSISALPQANLNLNNILSFILIGIGLVNIILGIAILVSSKK